MKLIKLTHNKSAIVSNIDFIYLSQWSWCVSRRCNNKRASRYFNVARYTKVPHSQSHSMARMILERMGHNFKQNEVPDHIKGNILDNRRSKIRVATISQNRGNSAKPSNRKYTSKYKGVHLHTDGRWITGTNINNKSVYLGSFHDEKEAARCYDEFAREYWGEFAKLNFKEKVND